MTFRTFHREITLLFESVLILPGVTSSFYLLRASILNPGCSNFNRVKSSSKSIVAVDPSATPPLRSQFIAVLCTVYYR